ncbi:MAG: PPC domain-containing protein [Gemmataceae bacterium]
MTSINSITKIITGALAGCVLSFAAVGTVQAQNFTGNLRSAQNDHKVRLVAGKKYDIQMTSRQFDTYLYLKSPQGKLVAKNDDGGTGHNSRIVYTAKQTGNYTIVASSYLQRGRGAYKIQIGDGGPNGADLKVTKVWADKTYVYGIIKNVGKKSIGGTSYTYVMSSQKSTRRESDYVIPLKPGQITGVRIYARDWLNANRGRQVSLILNVKVRDADNSNNVLTVKHQVK